MFQGGSNRGAGLKNFPLQGRLFDPLFLRNNTDSRKLRDSDRPARTELNRRVDQILGIVSLARREVIVNVENLVLGCVSRVDALDSIFLSIIVGKYKSGSQSFKGFALLLLHFPPEKQSNKDRKPENKERHNGRDDRAKMKERIAESSQGEQAGPNHSFQCFVLCD